MKRKISNAPVATFQVHPDVKKTYREKDMDCLRFTMEKFGQQTPVKVIERGGQMYIIDGVSRFKCATQLRLPSLIYEVVEVDDDKIMEYRLLSNVKTKRTFSEMCFEAEYVLNLIGSSQGKKREIMGFEDFLNDNNYGEIGKDRFELTCALIGIEMGGSTLRKALKVFWSEFNPDGKSKSGIIELLDEGRISIDKAHNLMCDRNRKKKEKEDTERAKMFIAHSNLSGGEKAYKLYNTSSRNMDEIPDNSVDLIVDSHCYAFGQRDYRNQDEMKHGQEKTREKYLENFGIFNEEKFRKLKNGGVLATILGESYEKGYQGICSRAELILEEIGFKIIDVVIWGKSNQQYATHPFRFQNSYERIIVAYKPGADPYFKDVTRKGCVDDFKVKPTSNGGYYIAKPETCIPNLIITRTHDSSIFKEIDPLFAHDAPCPPQVYEILIEAYSKSGDTVLDGFVGSGTVGVGLKMGRKVIGYDTDPLNIEFCQKRFEWFLQQAVENTLSVAA